MQKIPVNNIIIGKQFETSENYENFLKIIKEKKIKVIVVESKQKLNIEKNLYFEILWPNSNNIIRENSINNNSLVCKLVYKNFSMLFTGDIEEVAEKAILEKYKSNLNVLKCTILKVAHHGSKTSSTEEFINVVKPKIALIGVGKNNMFGHPSDVTLDNLKTCGCQIYRTDECGEITIKIDGKTILTNRFIMNKLPFFENTIKNKK